MGFFHKPRERSKHIGGKHVRALLPSSSAIAGKRVSVLIVYCWHSRKAQNEWAMYLRHNPQLIVNRQYEDKGKVIPVWVDSFEQLAAYQVMGASKDLMRFYCDALYGFDMPQCFVSLSLSLDVRVPYIGQGSGKEKKVVRRTSNLDAIEYYKGKVETIKTGPKPKTAKPKRNRTGENENASYAKAIGESAYTDKHSIPTETLFARAEREPLATKLASRRMFSIVDSITWRQLPILSNAMHLASTYAERNARTINNLIQSLPIERDITGWAYEI